MKKRTLLAIFAALTLGACALGAAACDGGADSSSASGGSTSSTASDTGSTDTGGDSSGTEEAWTGEVTEAEWTDKVLLSGANSFPGETANYTLTGSATRNGEAIYSLWYKVDGDKLSTGQTQGGAEQLIYFEAAGAASGTGSAQGTLYTQSDDGWTVQKDASISGLPEAQMAMLTYDKFEYDGETKSYVNTSDLLEADSYESQQGEIVFEADGSVRIEYRYILGGDLCIYTFVVSDLGTTEVTLPAV